jgi:hypothetical protein
MINLTLLKFYFLYIEGYKIIEHNMMQHCTIYNECYILKSDCVSRNWLLYINILLLPTESKILL